jgi:hypothetical protein
MGFELSYFLWNTLCILSAIVSVICVMTDSILQLGKDFIYQVRLQFIDDLKTNFSLLVYDDSIDSV